MSTQPCGNPRCGRAYEDTSSGRHNHRLVHGHAPRPVRTPYEQLIRDTERASQEKGGAA
ncbi:hypothetical protein [Isoptericola sp. NPDC056605]|uniref:hypothetical protein n=1 Tax=Isoptericola sp. NPDC056605 TaxID=3345876 RepID=UPI00369AA9CA